MQYVVLLTGVSCCSSKVILLPPTTVPGVMGLKGGHTGPRYGYSPKHLGGLPGSENTG